MTLFLYLNWAPPPEAYHQADLVAVRLSTDSLTRHTYYTDFMAGYIDARWSSAPMRPRGFRRRRAYNAGRRFYLRSRSRHS
jgi:hypothetical protein